jgi:hypothetical protein
LAKAEIPCTYILCERGEVGDIRRHTDLGLYEGSAPISKNTGVGPIKWLFLKKKKNHRCASLFNRTMNK